MMLLDTIRDTAAASDLSGEFSTVLTYSKSHPRELYNQLLFQRSWEMNVFHLTGYALLAVFTLLGWRLFFTSSLCRGQSFLERGIQKSVPRRQFSYARVQLFWWTFLILFCFLFFYARFGVLLPLNPTVVLLLGVTLSVLVAGTTIDNAQIANDKEILPTRYQDVNDSKGLFSDILTDDSGISLHRLQAFAFNAIFGISFLASFFSGMENLRYPLAEYEPWQLTLLGISASGYVGLKATENSAATESQRTIQAKTQARENTDLSSPSSSPGS